VIAVHFAPVSLFFRVTASCWFFPFFSPLLFLFRSGALPTCPLCSPNGFSGRKIRTFVFPLFPLIILLFPFPYIGSPGTPPVPFELQRNSSLLRECCLPPVHFMVPACCNYPFFSPWIDIKDVYFPDLPLVENDCTHGGLNVFSSPVCFLATPIEGINCLRTRPSSLFRVGQSTS